MKCTIFLVIFSATLFVSGAHVEYLWWLSFLWMAPLWYAMEMVSYNMIGALGYGLLWGFIALGGHIGGTLWGLCSMAQGPWTVRLIAPLLLLLYQSMISGLWFMCSAMIVRRPVYGRFACVVGTWLYILFVQHCALFPFGVWEGYPFFDPLLPLVVHPLLLGLLPMVGFAGMSALLILSVGCMYIFCVERTQRWLMGIVLCIGIWAASYSVGHTRLLYAIPHWISQMAIVADQFYASHDTYDTMACIIDYCVQVMREQPDVRAIFFPESSVYKIDCLNEGAEIFERLCTEKKVAATILIGGFRHHQKTCRNTIWWFYKGKNRAICDKQHTLLLSERMPPFCTYQRIRSLYFSTSDELEASNVPRMVWELFPGCVGIVYICSELFCAQYPRDPFDKTLIIALCNDSWAPEMTKQQMIRAARLRSIAWQRDILYITHTYAFYFTSSGAVKNLSPVLYVVDSDS